MATLELNDAEGVAQQLVEELGLPFYDEVVEWVTLCIGRRKAKAEAGVSSRAQGLHGSDLSWRCLQHKRDEHEPVGSEMPAKGEQKRKGKREVGR